MSELAMRQPKSVNDFNLLCRPLPIYCSNHDQVEYLLQSGKHFRYPAIWMNTALLPSQQSPVNAE